MPWGKGQSGNAKGRPRGILDRRQAEVRDLAVKIFDPAYWRLKYQRIHQGIENPRIEERLLAYAFGEPPKELHASGMIVHLGPLQALTEAIETEPTIDVQPDYQDMLRDRASVDSSGRSVDSKQTRDIHASARMR